MFGNEMWAVGAAAPSQLVSTLLPCELTQGAAGALITAHGGVASPPVKGCFPKEAGN